MHQCWLEPQQERWRHATDEDKDHAQRIEGSDSNREGRRSERGKEEPES